MSYFISHRDMLQIYEQRKHKKYYLAATVNTITRFLGQAFLPSHHLPVKMRVVYCHVLWLCFTRRWHCDGDTHTHASLRKY